MLAALRIGVLVERRAVEAAQGEVVGREVRRHPVDDHADAGVVQRVDHGGKVVGVPEPGRRCVVAGDLVAPRAVERVLGHRQQLDVREAEAAAMLDELLGRLSVPEPRPVGVAHPRAEVDLVGRHRRPIRIGLGSPAHPVVIGPCIDRWIPDARRRLRSDLHGEGERIGLQAQLAVVAEHLELVELADADAGDEDLPDARCAHRAHRHQAAVPAIEVADDAHAARVRRPHREAHARDPLVRPRVCTEHVIETLVRALRDQVQVDLAERRREPIRVVELPGVAIGKAEPDPIRELPGPQLRHEPGPQAVARAAPSAPGRRSARRATRRSRRGGRRERPCRRPPDARRGSRAGRDARRARGGRLPRSVARRGSSSSSVTIRVRRRPASRHARPYPRRRGRISSAGWRSGMAIPVEPPGSRTSATPPCSWSSRTNGSSPIRC